MRYALRLCLPDQPGALGAVASALGSAGIDVVSLTVVERGDGVAVDDVGVAGPVGPEMVRAILEQVRGVAVEAVTPLGPLAAGPSATALAAELAEHRDHGWQRLTDGLPSALGVAWAVAVGDTAAGLETLAASAAAPAVPGGLRLPFLPLQRPCRLPQAAWMPAAWCAAAGGARAELAATALAAPGQAVLVGRPGGPRFRQPELDRLCELVRVAVATSSLQPVAI